MLIPRHRRSPHSIRDLCSGWRLDDNDTRLGIVALGARMEDGLVAEMSIGITGAASHAFSADVATEFLMAKPLSSETIEEAAKLASEATVCLADRYASAEYRASLVRTETKRGLLTLAA